jgi:hypothetical protein
VINCEGSANLLEKLEVDWEDYQEYARQLQQAEWQRQELARLQSESAAGPPIPPPRQAPETREEALTRLRAKYNIPKLQGKAIAECRQMGFRIGPDGPFDGGGDDLSD